MKQTSLKQASIHELTAAFAKAAELHGQASVEGKHRSANAQYDKLIATSRELRARGEDGRSALTGLLEDSNPRVRLWAASHALEFAPALAEAELERLAQGPAGVVRLDAEMTLSEWRAGNLKFSDT
ncbi:MULTISPECIES: DUF2019 domain-containing protein [unclassified Corallococcus]|uniref:DUF2019 domain-containing protein n=1 Tax=unclassified Corallococcus TaxID=2685029 RepID=UPI001A8FCB2A|nr:MULTISPECIES: DUF2019 domain-containing protein [unclassified Corallococcus]MBN9682540.1 DUF2019 domain-containing protein [Corallococcus sp. NCSPR001]WAS85908.1 DUF2019 domain-containing protein [Corallococcus sp. NCRR]